MRSSLRSALVTGATGFLGSGLVRRLLAEHVEVTCLVRSESISKAAQFAGQTRIVEFHGADLENKLAGLSAEAVFHLASYGVQPGDRDLNELIEGNVLMLLCLIRATADWPLRRFVHTGSCSEYGCPERAGALITETHPLRPKSLYGAAKAASVLCGNALASTLNVPFVTLRLFGVFGTYEGPHRLVPYLISRLLKNQPVDLTKGEQVRDFLYEEDVAAAFVAAAISERLESTEVYNVCASRPTTIREIGELVADAMAKPRDLLHWGERPYRADEPMWMVGDNSRFRQATGSWYPAITLHEGIQRMIVNAQAQSTKRQ